MEVSCLIEPSQSEPWLSTLANLSEARSTAHLPNRHNHQEKASFTYLVCVRTCNSALCTARLASSAIPLVRLSSNIIRASRLGSIEHQVCHVWR